MKLRKGWRITDIRTGKRIHVEDVPDNELTKEIRNELVNHEYEVERILILK